MVTGSRSEFGLQENLFNLLRKDKKIIPLLVVTGSHLSKIHGNTVNDIKKKKIKIFKKINIINKNNSIPNQISKLIYYLSILINRYKPELVILVGDRYEALASAIAAYYLKIKIAHIHGGETTFNSLDDGARHSISKLADLHFVANKSFKKKLIDMGENRKFIYESGGLGVDAILSTKLINKTQLEKEINFKFKKENYLLTFHPEKNNINKQMNFLNKLFNYLSKKKNINIILKAPNSDLFNNLIIKEIKKILKKNKNNFKYIPSFGNKIYYSLLRQIDLVIGNSSSGICEVPTFKKPTINIGPRQDGRPRSKSVIDIDYNMKEFISSLKKVSNVKFKKKVTTCKNPYGNRKSSYFIYKKIKYNFNKNNFK